MRQALPEPPRARSQATLKFLGSPERRSQLAKVSSEAVFRIQQIDKAIAEALAYSSKFVQELEEKDGRIKGRSADLLLAVSSRVSVVLKVGGICQRRSPRFG